MVRYIRPKVRGFPVFFTVSFSLAQQGSRLVMDEIDVLREVVQVTRVRRPIVIAAWVVLPDHMHAVWRLPEGEGDYSDR